MKTTLTLLAVGTALVLPVAASAQSPADIAYCNKLKMLWYTYFEMDPSTSVATAAQHVLQRFGRRHSRAGKGPEGRWLHAPEEDVA